MKRTSAVLLAASIALLAARPADAGLILSFDQSAYTIDGVGDAVDVQVFLSQDADGPQVGPGNALLTAAIRLSFVTTGAAIIQSDADVAPGSVWDAGSADFSTEGADTLVDLGLTSIMGVSDLSSPLLLGTFTFTARAAGVAPISVITLGPGASFITENLDILDPVNTAEARIEVSAIPEPTALFSASAAVVVLGALAARRRKRAA